MLSLLRARVQFLVRELRSCKPCGAAKKKIKKTENRNRLTDIENKLMVTRGEKGVVNLGVWVNKLLCIKILDWPKSSFGFFCNILRENPNKLFGQPNT